jgi:hypothetical protein
MGQLGYCPDHMETKTTTGRPAPVVGTVKSSPKKFMATLVHGKDYFYGTLRFEKGVAVPVTTEVAEALRESMHRRSILDPNAEAEGNPAYVDDPQPRFKIEPITPISSAPMREGRVQPAPVRGRARSR